MEKLFTNTFYKINFTNIQNVINSRPSNNIKLNLYLLYSFSTILQQKTSQFFTFSFIAAIVSCSLKVVETFYLHPRIRIKICLKPSLAQFIDIYCLANVCIKYTISSPEDAQYLYDRKMYLVLYLYMDHE